MKGVKKFLSWFFTIFMGLFAVSFFPSISSIIAIIFVLISAPIAPLQDFLSAHRIRGKGKVALLFVIFYATFITAPNQEPSDTRTIDNPTFASASISSGAPEPSATLESTPTPEPTPTPKPEPTPTPKPTPAPDPTPDPTPMATQSSQAQSGGHGGSSGNANNFNTYDNPENQNTSAKWILNTSTMKIHYPSCSDVRRIAPHNKAESNLSESQLLAQGYTTCGRCH